MKQISLDAAWGRAVIYRGTSYLHFGGTSYLGMHCHPDFIGAISEAGQHLGSHFGASRSSNLGLSVYTEAESALANFFGAPAALLTSSGYMAGQLLYHYYRMKEYTLLHTPGTHPALGPPDLEETSWEEVEQVLGQKEVHPVVFMDSITNSRKGWPEFTPLQHLDLGASALVVDDSHGFGVVDQGRGCFSRLQHLQTASLTVCGSLGKAMALPAGIILGAPEFLESLRKSPVYRTASPPSPAPLQAFIKNSHLFTSQWERLQENLQRAHPLLSSFPQLRHQEHYPVYTFRDEALAQFLKESGILVTYFKYQGYTEGRIVISALHEEEDLEYLGKVLAAFYRK